MITLEQYKEFPKSEIFKRGVGLDGLREVRWLEIKWADGKWSMLYDYIKDVNPWDSPSESEEWEAWAERYDKKIRYFGKRFSIPKRAQRLVKCSDEVVKLYKRLNA